MNKKEFLSAFFVFLFIFPELSAKNPGMNFFSDAGVTAGKSYRITVQIKDRKHSVTGSAVIQKLTRNELHTEISTEHGNGYLRLKSTGQDSKNSVYILDYKGSFMNRTESFKGKAAADRKLLQRGFMFLVYKDAEEKAVQITVKEGVFRIVTDRALFILEPKG